MRGYRDLAADLRRRIESGEYPAGSTLPPITDLMEEHGLAKQTVRSALAELANQGFVITRRKYGTLVRDRSAVRIPLSRYGQVLTPGGTMGPWEAACAAQGLAGRMKVVGVQREAADKEISALLNITPGDEVIHRRRNALINDEVVQVQHAWYPAGLADRAGISEASKIEGGIFGALIAAGIPPVSADETVTSGIPSAQEAAELQIGTGVPILRIRRLTRTTDGTVLEVLKVSAPSDRVELCYDQLPIGERA
ncbi:GntR family transcriptional regulator [Streptomyces sp. NPDC056045]|uniref:GntR family transcriptional regulator n=1 Tax=Streptomyces sp. NPDC056045 TaxID=3345691 RepID=UPI0035DE3CD9